MARKPIEDVLHQLFGLRGLEDVLRVGGAVKDDPFLGLARLIELPAAGRKMVPFGQ